MSFQKITLGQTKLIVSRVGFGVHPLGPTRRNLSLEDGAQLMCKAYEMGIRLYDTAQFYQTYHYLDRAIELIKNSPFYEGDPVISSKSLEETYKGMQEAIEEALVSLHRKQIDIFLMHQVTPGDQEKRAGAWQALCDAKREGRVKAIGISTHHEDVAEAAAGIPELDVVFALYNYSGLGIRRGDRAGSAEGMLSALQSCKAAGKGVYTMKVFGGGNLTNDYQAAAKHVFVDCREVIEAAVIGFTDERELIDLAELLGGSLDPAYNPPVDGKKLRVDREDCMGCGTCVAICASGAMHYSRVDGLAEIDYDKCVGCSYCAIACPERAIVLW